MHRKRTSVVAIGAVAALALAVVVVSPGSAQTKGPRTQAKGQRTRRSVTGNLSGVGSPVYALPPGNSFGADETGVIRPLGRVAYHVDGTFVKRSGKFVLDGWATIVTKNGRGLIGAYHGTTRTGAHVAASVHITGGSGRYADAHGTWALTDRNTPTPNSAFPNRSETKITGHIKY